MKNIDELWAVDPRAFILLVAVVSVECLGVVQAVKKYWKPPCVLLAFICAFICGIVQTSYIGSRRFTSAFNIIMMSFSMITLAAQGWLGVIRAAPEMLLRVAEKKLGVEEKDG